MDSLTSMNACDEGQYSCPLTSNHLHGNKYSISNWGKGENPTEVHKQFVRLTDVQLISVLER